MIRKDVCNFALKKERNQWGNDSKRDKGAGTCAQFFWVKTG